MAKTKSVRIYSGFLGINSLIIGACGFFKWASLEESIYFSLFTYGILAVLYNLTEE